MGGSLDVQRNTHARREASSTIRRYDEYPSNDSTTRSRLGSGRLKSDVEARIKPKSMKNLCPQAVAFSAVRPAA